jgi:hypothetical protein
MLKRTLALWAATIALLAGTALVASPAYADDNSNTNTNTNQTQPSTWPQNGQGHGGQGNGWGRGGRPMMGMGTAGKVTTVNGDTITITGRNNTTYTVDATNATVMKAGATTTVSSIAVGDTIFAQGTVSGTNVTATKILDGLMRVGFGLGKVPGQGRGQGNGGGPAALFQGNGEPVVAGIVSSVSGDSFSFTNSGNATYTVDDTNALIRKGNATSTPGVITTGDHVLVQGSVNGTSITATTVIDQAVTNNSGNVKNPRNIFGSIGSFFKHLFGF